MAVTHTAATKTAIATAVLGEIDADSPSVGDLVFLTAADGIVATLPLANPAGTVSGAVLTFTTNIEDTNASAGTIAKARIEDNSANVVLEISSVASPSGGDINLSTLVIDAADTVRITSLTYTAP